MKKLFIASGVVWLLMLSCSFGRTIPKRDNYIIPDSLLSFFPDESDKYKDLKTLVLYGNVKKSELPLFLSEFDPGILLEFYKSKDGNRLRNIIDEYRKQALTTVRSESKDYFVIGEERELIPQYDTLTLKKYYFNLGDKYLILHFREILESLVPDLFISNSTYCGLPDGYEILILKSGNDFVLPPDSKYEWAVLPDNLRHGYRSGVAFKEGEAYIIYWVVAW